jgi:plastocyanin
MTRRTIAILLLMCCAAPPCFARGPVRGTLHPPGLASAAVSRAPDDDGRYADAVVYLEDAPAKLEKKLAKKAHKAKLHIVQQRLAFTPRVLAVAIGDTVEIENLDRVYHNTFSVSPAKRFDLGKYAPGFVTPIVFDNAGIVNLHCDIHPSEAGFVVAVPNHIFTRPDSLGRFKLPKLPVGSYTLKVWHPRMGTITRAFDVKKKGNVDLELRF